MNNIKFIVFALLFFYVGYVQSALRLVDKPLSDDKIKLLNRIAEPSPTGKAYWLNAEEMEKLTESNEREAVKNYVLTNELYKNKSIDIRNLISSRNSYEGRRRDKLLYWLPLVVMYATADLANSRSNGIVQSVAITGGVALVGARVASFLESYNSTNNKISEYVCNPKKNHYDWYLFCGFANSIIMIPVQWLFARQQLPFKILAGALEIIKLWIGSGFHYLTEVFVDNDRTKITFGDLVNGPKFRTTEKEIQ